MYCTNLKRIYVDENNTKYSTHDGVLFNKNKTKILSYPRNKSNSFVIPNTVKTIGDNAFRNSNLTNITIPNSVTTIGDSAFYDSQLTSITIPNSVTSISDYAFASNQLTSVTIPNSVTEIGRKAFQYNKLTNVTIPNSVTSIGDSVFFNNQLTSVTISNSITSIGDYLFCNNQLTNVIIPNSVTSIGVSAFDTNQLTSVTIPSSVTSIGKSAFNKNQLTSVTIPSSVTSIDVGAFCNNQLTSVTIPSSVTSIKGAVFSNNQLTSVTIPNSVTEIDTYTFQNNQLTSVTIPSSVTSIGHGAFENNQLTSVTISDGVTKIGNNAFCNNQLTSVTIPNSVTEIGTYAFENNKLTSVTIPDSVTKIDKYVFQNNQLTNVTIPDSVTEIGKYAFENNKLTKIIIPNNVILESHSFGGNPTLLYAVVPGNADITFSFYGVTDNFKIFVRKGNKNTENISSYFKNYEYLTLDSIRIKTNPTKTSYLVGENFNAEGLVVNAVYNYTYNNTTESIEFSLDPAEYTISPSEGLQLGTTGLTLTHTNNNITKTVNLPITVYEEDTTAPTINSVTGNATSWTNQNVTLTVNATDSQSNSLSYSFDNGSTWQSVNAKIYSQNTNGIKIQVKDAAGNVATYASTINIDKIDKTAPNITSVTGNATQWTNQNVTLTVNATDSQSNSLSYSFDNGATWQSDKAEIYSQNTNGIKIQVKDSAGNIATYASTINIDKIDKTAPTITITPNGASTAANKNVKITVADNGGSGLSSNNSYQYQLSTSSTVIPTGAWNTYTSGTEFTIGNGLNGDYYLWVKSISDNANNKSSQTNYVVTNKFTFANTQTNPDITSDTYTIDENNFITNVLPNTNVNTLLQNLISSNEIKVYNKDNQEITGETIIGTGMKVVSNDKEYTLLIKGDVNGTGTVDLNDAINVLQHIAKGTNPQLTRAYLKAAQLTKQGEVSLNDVIKIMKYKATNGAEGF